jgi:hypothetical protein
MYLLGASASLDDFQLVVASIPNKGNPDDGDIYGYIYTYINKSLPIWVDDRPPILG